MEIFGTEVMVHVPKQKRKKWDKRAEKLIFVGYSNETKGYRCIDPKTRKLTLSRDVKFLESEKVILNLNNDNNKNPEDINIIETTEQSLSDNDEPVQDESIITINNSSVFDDTEDSDYEPSDETILEAEQEEADELHEQKKSKKVNANPLSLTNYAFFIEPQSYKEANSSDEAKKWTDAMNEEMQSHDVNGTWTFTTLPEGKKAIKNKWVYKLKKNQNQNLSW